MKLNFYGHYTWVAGQGFRCGHDMAALDGTQSCGEPAVIQSVNGPCVCAEHYNRCRDSMRSVADVPTLEEVKNA